MSNELETCTSTMAMVWMSANQSLSESRIKCRLQAKRDWKMIYPYVDKRDAWRQISFGAQSLSKCFQRFVNTKNGNEEKKRSEWVTISLHYPAMEEPDGGRKRASKEQSGHWRRGPVCRASSPTCFFPRRYRIHCHCTWLPWNRIILVDLTRGETET